MPHTNYRVQKNSGEAPTANPACGDPLTLKDKSRPPQRPKYDKKVFLQFSPQTGHPRTHSIQVEKSGRQVDCTCTKWNPTTVKNTRQSVEKTLTRFYMHDTCTYHWKSMVRAGKWQPPFDRARFHTPYSISHSRAREIPVDLSHACCHTAAPHLLLVNGGPRGARVGRESRYLA